MSEILIVHTYWHPRAAVLRALDWLGSGRRQLTLNARLRQILRNVRSPTANTIDIDGYI
jgi:hypothetical protein